MMIRSEAPMKTAKISYIVMSAAMAVLGVILIAAPEALGDVMCTIIGISAVVFGTVKIIGYFSKDLFRLAFQHDLAGGLLLILLGITAVAKPQSLLNSAAIILGMLILADGLLKIQVAVDAKTFGITKWWLILAAAIVTATAGLCMIVFTAESLIATAVILGVSLITESILNLITVLSAVKIVKNQLADEIVIANPAHTH